MGFCISEVSSEFPFCGAVFSLVLFASLNLNGSRADDGWSPTPNAPVLYNGIYAWPNLIQARQTLILVKGSKLTLTAWAVDVDTLTVGESTTLVAEDGTEVVWSVSNNQATLSAERVASGAGVELTAPMVPQRSTELTFTVTAKPDDNSTEDPGGPLEYAGTTYGGNRNDQPGTGSSISIKVIKQCPPSVGLGTQCSPSTNDFNRILFPAQSQLRVFGDLFSQKTVSGGTPSSPAKNWNGLVIQEEVALKPNDEGSMADGDIDQKGVVRANICSGGSYFVVGSAAAGSTGQVLHGCTFAAADNSFWDHYGASAALPQIVDDPDSNNRSAKTVICKQTYRCASGAALAPPFEITRSFTNEFRLNGTRPGSSGAHAVGSNAS